MSKEHKTFRVFISSTFTDLKVERNALQKYVYPRLHELCMAHGCRFQAMDLRWGISHEASLDQRTLQICFSELKRCQDISPRPNFIVLLGDRYGWQPLPEEIRDSEFETILSQIKDHQERDLLKQWYRRDENAVPPVYVLQTRERGSKWENHKTWEVEVEQPLRNAMIHAIQGLALSEKERLIYEASATHQEIEQGSMLVDDAEEHVFGFLRIIDNLDDLIAELPCEAAGAYVDTDSEGKHDAAAHNKLASLKSGFAEKIGPRNIYEFSSQWKNGSVTTTNIGYLPTSLDECEAKFNKTYVPQNLCEAVWCKISRIIKWEIEHIKDRSAVEIEEEIHQKFRKERARIFIGRTAIQEEIKKYLSDDRKEPLAIYGTSGSGKSALIAKAVQNLLNDDDKNMKWIERYIGVSPESSNIRLLLTSLCRSINLAYGQGDFIAPDTQYKLEQAFEKRLNLATNRKPLVIFLDALDQLSQIDNAHKLAWLPKKLPANVKIVVSTLSDEQHTCYNALQDKLPQGNLNELKIMSVKRAEQILDFWLREAKRTLQPNQRKEVLDKFEKNGLPLYLKFAFEEVRQWRSYDRLPVYDNSIGLGESMTDIIKNLFWRLSRPENHGPLLVSQSLGYLTAAKNGLSEDEIIDLLSDYGEFLALYKRSIYYELPEDKVPDVVWSRLYHDLEPYLTRLNADGTTLLSFYHRQIKETAKKFFLSQRNKENRHSEMASYFDKQDLEILHKEHSSPNLRKLSELPFQMAYAGWHQELQQLLTDFHFMETKVRAVGPQPLIEDFQEGFRVGLRNKVLIAISDTLRMIAHVIAEDSDQLAGQLVGRLFSSKSEAIQSFLGDIRVWNKKPWFCPLAPTLPPPGGVLVRTISGHTDWVEAVAVFPDGMRAISVSDDMTVRIWDLEQGRELICCHGHTDKVRSAVVAPSGKFIISGSDDMTVRVWDAEQGRELRRLTDHSGGIGALDISPDGKRLITGADDMTLKVWDLENGALLATLQGHSDWIRGVAITPDGTKVISVSDDATVKIWSLLDRTLIRTLIGHNREVCGVAVSTDGRYIVTCSSDMNLKVWDLTTGELLHILSGHTDFVRHVATVSNRPVAVSASDDGKLRIWDIEKGVLVRTLPGHSSAVWGVAVTPDGKHAVSGGGDGVLKVWNLEQEEEYQTIIGHPEWSVTDVAITPTGKKAVSVSNDKTLKIWDLEDIKVLHTLTGHSEEIRAVALTPNGQIAVTASSDTTLKVWNLETEEVLYTLSGHTGWVQDVVITPDECHIISASHDASLSVWNLKNGSELFPIDAHKKDVTAVAVFPDGERVVSASWDHTIKIFNLKTGQHIDTVSESSPGIWDLEVLPDGKRIIAACDDGAIRIWDLESRKTISTLYGHKTWVRDIAIMPDGCHFLSVSGDCTLKLWNLTCDKPIATFTCEAPLLCCSVAVVEKTIIAGGQSGQIHFLHLKALNPERKL